MELVLKNVEEATLALRLLKEDSRKRAFASVFRNYPTIVNNPDDYSPESIVEFVGSNLDATNALIFLEHVIRRAAKIEQEQDKEKKREEEERPPK